MDAPGGYPGNKNRGAGGYCRNRNGRSMGQVDWKYVVSASILAGVLSLLTSVAGLPELKEEK